jgi:hypothetical protein
MKRLYLIFSFVFCLTGNALGQDTTRRSIDVGIDVLKSVWPLVGLYPDLRTAYTLEPIFIIPLNKPGRYVHITPGFTSFNTHPAVGSQSITQSGHGYYIKVGHERRIRKLGIGAAMLLSAWQDEGTYHLKGSYFGDYAGITPRQNRLAIGSEFFIGEQIPVSKRFTLRIQFRVNIVAPFTSHNERPMPAYLPGVGLLTGGDWTFGEGLSVQLLYRTSSKARNP